MTAKVYIHEFVNITGHNRARYMQHITANWSPIGREERNQLCYGIWGTVGSTASWPEVINMWEFDGWEGLAGNLNHELSSPTLQDPALAEWWARAESLRRGGFDRIMVAAPWCRSITQLVEEGVRGALYAHELIRVPPGKASDLLRLVETQGRGTGGVGGRGADRRFPHRHEQRLRVPAAVGLSRLGHLGPL